MNRSADANNPEAPAASVLVVEDDAAVREFTAQALEAFGHAVIRSANGEEALAALDEPANHVALVLTDVVMPHMGGVELARRINARGLDVSILYMSSDLLSESDLTSKGADFIAKPFRVNDLVERVRRAIAFRNPPRRPVWPGAAAS